MKKELKNTIAETVSTLRKLLVKLKDISDSKTKAISDLETAVTKIRAQYEDGREMCNKGHAAPSVIPNHEPLGSRAQVQAAPPFVITQEPAYSNAQRAAPPGGRREKLYSAAIGNKLQQQHFKLTVKSKDNLSSETIKGLLKSKINPTEIKVGINSFKTLTDGRMLTTISRKEEAEALEMYIKTKCGEEPEAILHRRRNPRLFIRNIPEDITTSNIEGTLIKQNSYLNLKAGDINARYCYETKKHSRNLVAEVNAQTRKLLLQKKVKLGWMICKVEDCRGEETCPLCAGSHKMKECTAESYEYKCINCATYNLHNKNARICENHSTLDRNCPSLQALLERYRQKRLLKWRLPVNSTQRATHGNIRNKATYDACKSTYSTPEQQPITS